MGDKITICDCIKSSLNENESINMRPIVWEMFLMNFCAVMVGITSQLLDTPMPEATIKGEYAGGGSSKENNPMPFMEVLLQIDFVRGTSLFHQVRKFFDWYLEQDNEQFQSDDAMWYDHDAIGNAWNEFARIQNEQ